MKGWRNQRARWAVLLLLVPALLGCERLEKWLFMRYSPKVDRAVRAIQTHDAGDAVALLTDYLSTGRCKAGSLGTPDSVRAKPNATLDLGLALFELAERYGQKFGEELLEVPAGSPESGQFLKRSQEVDCAQRLVRLIAADKDIPLGLRAEAYYLSGNLEFLRGDYESAVQSYDSTLELVPGGSEDAGESVGTKAAWNRAIALRRAEEQEPPEQPDAGKPPPSDAGAENEGEEGQQDNQEQDPSEQDQSSDSEQQEQSENNQNQDQSGDQQQEEQQQERPTRAGPSEPPEAAAPATPHRPSLSQDEQILEMLERAPMLQQELPKIRGRGVARPSMEDK